MQPKLNYKKKLEKDLVEFLLLVSEQPLLLAIRRGLIQILPLIIAGAAALLLLNFPIHQVQNILDKVFGPGWRYLCNLIQQGSFGIASLACLITISSTYARLKSASSTAYSVVNPPITAVICLAAYFVLAAPLDGSLPSVFFSLTGGFPIALCVVATAGPMFVYLTAHRPFKKFFDAIGSDPVINDALSAVPTGMAVLLLFGLTRLILGFFGLNDLHQQAQTLFGAPFKGAESNLGVGLGYLAISQTLWFFGVHGPNLLISVEQNILTAALQANQAALAHGMQPVHILTKPFLDAFVHIGGSGSTLALILAIFIGSKEKNNKRLAVAALAPTLINVNEVILFGLPLVLNPIYVIPFLLAPMIQLIVAYAATVLHLVPVTVGSMHWTAPIFIGGYAAAGSIAGSILQLVCLGVGTMVYIPFVKLANQIDARRFKKTMTNIIQAADEGAARPAGYKCVNLPGQAGRLAKALAADLAEALDRDDQIFLVFQPQIDVDQAEVSGVEALLRWMHPVHGMIPPHVAVALAEDTGIISKLGLRVLADGCRRHAELLERTRSRPVLSVNMSAPQFADDKLVEKVLEVLQQTGLEPNLLKIEVTESLALTPEVKTIDILHRLRELGIRVAIDDFGMGHTSLRYLKEFPVDTVKIDRSLTQEAEDGVQEHIITSIVNLCEALGIQIIVEGAETIEQVNRFRTFNCSIFQGYYFSKPLTVENCLEYICHTGPEQIRARLADPDQDDAGSGVEYSDYALPMPHQ